MDITKEAKDINSTDMTDAYRCPVYHEWWKAKNPNAPASSWDQLGYGMSFRMIYNNGWPGVEGEATNYSAPGTMIQNPAKTVLVGPASSWNLNFERARIDGFIDHKHGITRARRHGDFAVYLMAHGSVQSIEATRDALLPYVTN